MNRESTRSERLSEGELDEIAIAEADNDAAWKAPVKVKPNRMALARFQNDPRFLKRIEAARQSFRDGRGVPLEEIPE